MASATCGLTLCREERYLVCSSDAAPPICMKAAVAGGSNECWMPTVVFHVTSTRNRESILRHGLDCRRWLGDPGVAGPDRPESEFVFLARDDFEVDWFISMSRRYLTSVDVWEVVLPHDVDLEGEELPPDVPYQLIDGYLCSTDPIPPDRLRLLRTAST